MSGRNRASSHGPRRSNADKRRAVLTMLQDEEWQRCSLSEIAARCRVSRTLVADIKSELEADGAHPAEKQDETITVKRRGKSYSMNVTKMRQNTQGRKKSADKLAPDFSADLDATLVEVL